MESLKQYVQHCPVSLVMCPQLEKLVDLLVIGEGVDVADVQKTFQQEVLVLFRVQ